jgi:sec-independent protein translocase protein TatC
MSDVDPQTHGGTQVGDPLLGAAVAGAPLNGHGSSTLDGTAEGDGAKMTLLEHIAELRKRVLIMALSVVVTSIAGWFLYEPVLSFVHESYKNFCHAHPGKLISCNFLVLGPTEGFLTRLKIASYIGIALAAPVWLWEVWRFITPGLTKNEKKYAIPFVASALVLFSMGVGTAILIWPHALTWLIDVAGPSVTTGYSLTSYVSLYLLVCLVFGGVFLYPIIVVFLMIAGVVPSKTWRKWRRAAIVVICVVAAVVTPSNDPFTFMALAIPMMVFYEASIIIGRIMKK